MIMSLNLKKLEAVILFLASHPKVKTLGKTKLYKLIYFADVSHLRDYGSTITGSEYIKYQYGPVPSRGEKILKTLKRQNQISMQRRVLSGDREVEEIAAIDNPFLKCLSQTEIKTLNTIAAELGFKTAGILSDLSHQEPAWCYAKDKDKLDPDLMMYGHEENSDGL